MNFSLTILLFMLIMSLIVATLGDAFSLGSLMVIRPHHPLQSPFLRPPHGLEIAGVLYLYAIDIMTILDNKTSNPVSNYFAVGCRMGSHVGLNDGAPYGVIPNPNPICVLNNIPIMPVLNCNVNACDPVYGGLRPKTQFEPSLSNGIYR